MHQACPDPVTCPGTDSPFLNLSSETPDTITVLERAYSYNPGGVIPPLNRHWELTACGVVIEVSDEPFTAQVLAIAAAIRCSATNQGGCNEADFLAPILVVNQVQVCNVPTPFGIGQFTVEEGIIPGCTQPEADIRAEEIACFFARQGARMRMTDIIDGCSGEIYSDQIRPSGGVAPYSMVIASGSLPPGITFTNGIFYGTPNTAGNYTFSVQLRDSRGAQLLRSYTIDILGITNPDCDPANSGVAYSFQFIGAGGTGPYTFTIISGALPTGLTMDASGLISGTPTATGDFSIGLLIQDSLNATCQQTASLSVGISSCLCVPLCADRVKIDGFVDGMFTILTVPCDPGGGGGFPTASGLPHWDGKFDIYDSPNPNCRYLIGLFSIQGWDAANVFVDNITNPGFWTLFIGIDDLCTASTMQFVWVGQKAIAPGDDPTGTYTALGTYAGQPVVNGGDLTLVKY